MTRAFRTATLAAVLAAGVFVGAGCASNSDCTENPKLSDFPSSCSLAANTSVTVSVVACDCDASVACDVEMVAGGIQLTPTVNSCSASCPVVPSGCSTQRVDCTFTMPSSDPGSLYLVDGTDLRTVALNIGAGSSCNP